METPVVEILTDKVPVSIQQKVRQLIERAKAFTKIVTIEARREADEVFKGLGSVRRETERALEDEVAPTLVKEREIRAPYNLVLDTIGPSETALKAAFKTFDTAEAQRVREEQEKINARTDQKNEREFAKAAEIGAQPVTHTPKVVATTPKTTTNEAGQSSTRIPIKEWSISGIGPDEKLDKLHADDPRLEQIERKFLLLDVPKLKRFVKDGEQPAGVKVFDSFDYRSKG